MSLSPVGHLTIDFDNPIDEIANLLAHYSPRPEFQLFYRQLAASMFGLSHCRLGVYYIDTKSDDVQINDLIKTANRLIDLKSFVMEETIGGLIKAKEALDKQTMTIRQWFSHLTGGRVSPQTAIFYLTVKPCELAGNEHLTAPVRLSWALTVAAGGVWLHSAEHVPEHGENLGRMIEEFVAEYREKNPWVDSPCMTGAVLRLPESAIVGNRPMFVCKSICSIQELKNAVWLGDSAKASQV